MAAEVRGVVRRTDFFTRSHSFVVFITYAVLNSSGGSCISSSNRPNQRVSIIYWCSTCATLNPSQNKSERNIRVASQINRATGRCQIATIGWHQLIGLHIWPSYYLTIYYNSIISCCNVIVRSAVNNSIISCCNVIVRTAVNNSIISCCNVIVRTAVFMYFLLLFCLEE